MEPTNDLSFSTILDCLSCGCEIEFSYQGKQYSITNDSQGNWNFCCDTDSKLIQCICPFEDKNTLLSYVKMQNIEGTPLFEIFDKMLYDDSSVCVL